MDLGVLTSAMSPSTYDEADDDVITHLFTSPEYSPPGALSSPTTAATSATSFALPARLASSPAPSPGQLMLGRALANAMASSPASAGSSVRGLDMLSLRGDGPQRSTCEDLRQLEHLSVHTATPPPPSASSSATASSDRVPQLSQAEVPATAIQPARDSMRSPSMQSPSSPNSGLPGICQLELQRSLPPSWQCGLVPTAWVLYRHYSAGAGSGLRGAHFVALCQEAGLVEHSTMPLCAPHIQRWCDALGIPADAVDQAAELDAAAERDVVVHAVSSPAQLSAPQWRLLHTDTARRAARMAMDDQRDPGALRALAGPAAHDAFRAWSDAHPHTMVHPASGERGRLSFYGTLLAMAHIARACAATCTSGTPRPGLSKLLRGPWLMLLRRLGDVRVRYVADASMVALLLHWLPLAEELCCWAELPGGTSSSPGTSLSRAACATTPARTPTKHFWRAQSSTPRGGLDTPRRALSRAISTPTASAQLWARVPPAVLAGVQHGQFAQLRANITGNTSQLRRVIQFYGTAHRFLTPLGAASSTRAASPHSMGAPQAAAREKVYGCTHEDACAFAHAFRVIPDCISQRQFDTCFAAAFAAQKAILRGPKSVISKHMRSGWEAAGCSDWASLPTHCSRGSSRSSMASELPAALLTPRSPNTLLSRSYDRLQGLYPARGRWPWDEALLSRQRTSPRSAARLVEPASAAVTPGKASATKTVLWLPGMQLLLCSLAAGVHATRSPVAETYDFAADAHMSICAEISDAQIDTAWQYLCKTMNSSRGRADMAAGQRWGKRHSSARGLRMPAFVETTSPDS